MPDSMLGTTTTFSSEHSLRGDSSDSGKSRRKLFPMRIPTIAIPLKETEPIDFKPAFQAYISSMYGEDPLKFEGEIQEINQARNALLELEPTIRGRDAIYRYYGQLELLQLRFEIDEDHMKLDFNWRDAFSKEQVCQHSIAFEKASVIFNVAALLSRMAALADRSEVSGLKMAYNYFQASAGMFQVEILDFSL